MAKLSADEEKALRRLMAKREAPDSPPAGRSLNISIDLGDDRQVERAQRLGLLDMFSDDDEDEDKEQEQEDEAPKRRGYFTEGS